jgi:hypothetical protein
MAISPEAGDTFASAPPAVALSMPRIATQSAPPPARRCIGCWMAMGAPGVSVATSTGRIWSDGYSVK